LGIADDLAGGGRGTAAPVFTLDVALELAQRVVAAQAQARGGPIGDLEVHPAVVALEVVVVLDQAEVEAPSELVLDLARRVVDARDVEIAELPVDAVQAHGPARA